MEKITFKFQKKEDMRLAIDKAKDKATWALSITKSGPKTLEVPFVYIDLALKILINSGLKLHVEVI